MDKEIRWGIAGTGRIADTVAAEFNFVEGAELVAVGSREIGRAAAFAEQHRLPRAHGSYADLVTDPDLDVIYIATPHPQHRDLALAAIEAGKGVLVEKAFTATYEGAQQVVAAARERGVFAMEAMWTRFLPIIGEVRRIVDEGTIGQVLSVQADLGAYRKFDPWDRLFDPNLGGGAMLDLGVYLVSLAEYFLGDPEDISTKGTHYPNGVEAAFGMVLRYPGDRVATLAGALNHPSPGRAFVAGEAGWIEIAPRFHHPQRIVVHPRDGEAVEIERTPLGAGYTHELIEVTECVRAGRTESATMPLDSTLSVQRVLDEACAQLGVRPSEATLDL